MNGAFDLRFTEVYRVDFSVQNPSSRNMASLLAMNESAALYSFVFFFYRSSGTEDEAAAL